MGCVLKRTMLRRAPPCAFRLQSASAAPIAAMFSVLPSPMAPYRLTSHSTTFSGDEDDWGGRAGAAAVAIGTIGTCAVPPCCLPLASR